MTDSQTDDGATYRIHDEPPVETTDAEAAEAAREIGYCVDKVSNDA